jgi:HEAT repeat protein
VRLQDDATRLDALSALARLGGEARHAVPGLIELLRDEDQLIVTKVLKTLEAIGPPAREAEPALVELASDPDYLIRLNARAALKVVSPAAAARFDGAR